MDIEKYIEKRCPHRFEDNDCGVHDRAFEKALKENYEFFKDNSRAQLKSNQTLAREAYRLGGNSHFNTARCMIIFEMLEEKWMNKVIK